MVSKFYTCNKCNSIYKLIDILPIKDKKASCLKCNNTIKIDENIIVPTSDQLEKYYEVIEEVKKRAEKVSEPLDHQSFVEDAKHGEVWIIPSNRSDFLSYIWKTRTKNLFWGFHRQSLFWGILLYHFSFEIYWTLYIAGIGLLSTTFFLRVDLPWYLKIVVIIAFVFVSLFFGGGYWVVYTVKIEDWTEKRLTSACVSDKRLYLEGIEKNLLKECYKRYDK